jgi:hypothetical protein
MIGRQAFHPDALFHVNDLGFSERSITTASLAYGPQESVGDMSVLPTISCGEVSSAGCPDPTHDLKIPSVMLICFVLRYFPAASDIGNEKR